MATRVGFGTLCPFGGALDHLLGALRRQQNVTVLAIDLLGNLTIAHLQTTLTPATGSGASSSARYRRAPETPPATWRLRLRSFQAVALFQEYRRQRSAGAIGIVVDNNILIDARNALSPRAIRPVGGASLLVVEPSSRAAAPRDLDSSAADEDTVSAWAADARPLGSLDVDVEDHVDPALETWLDASRAGAVVVVVHLRPLEELVVRDHVCETCRVRRSDNHGRRTSPRRGLGWCS